MFIENRKNEINNILLKMAEILDISPSQYEDAVSKYQAVADYLGRDLEINKLMPEMYPQGSFNLGTIIKPSSDEEEYDIDLVCELKLGSTKTISQDTLKNLIGNRLKSGMYKEKLKDLDGGRRCWTIEYSESAKLHLDILPAIPDYDSRILFESKSFFEHSENYGKTAISITDSENEYYYELHDDWVKSNPKGYLTWFKEQMLTSLNESRKLFSEANKTKIDEVPDYKIKTPLQRAIQLLKRHRDTTCGDNVDKPISIIITTLSALAYKNENNLYDALTGILKNMSNHIEHDIQNGKKVAIISNPVDYRENFADKWEFFPNKEKVFYDWLNDAQIYFENLFKTEKEIGWINESLSSGFGSGITRKTFSAIANETRTNRENGILRMENITGILGTNIALSESKKVTDHKFHGNEK